MNETLVSDDDKRWKSPIFCSVNADDIYTIVLHNKTQHSAVARVLRLYSIAMDPILTSSYPVGSQAVNAEWKTALAGLRILV